MGTPLSTFRTAALASALGFVFLTPAGAAPLFVPQAAKAESDVVKVTDSMKVLRRKHFDHDADGHDGRKRRHWDGRRDHARHDHDHDGWRRFRPKDTPKYAYDAFGNYRVYDGEWDDWDGRDWKRKKRKHHRPKIIKMNSFGYQDPPAALKEILTAVPGGGPPAQ
jgi:hypothetical protein